jgi:enoyl-CoA hydratase/carnithine racemase
VARIALDDPRRRNARSVAVRDAVSSALHIAIMCDIRVAADTARFAHPEIAFGDVVYGPLHRLDRTSAARRVEADEGEGGPTRGGCRRDARSLTRARIQLRVRRVRTRGLIARAHA